MGSPYDVLSVAPDADEEAVRRAYRERVKEVHPDQGGSVAEFRRVKDAYERILDGEAAEVEVDLDGVEDPEPNGDTHEDDDTEEAGPRVTYVDYDALSDNGWNLGDEDLFEKAAQAGLSAEDYGEFTVGPDETLLEAAEEAGFAWPYSCRGGACANCAVAVEDGEMSMPANHILPPEMVDRGIRLSCVGAPTTDEMAVVFNVKHLPGLDELRLPPDPYERALDD